MNADRLGMIRDCAARGLSFTETAVIAGVSKVTVFKYMRKYGIEFHPGPARYGCTTEQYQYLRQIQADMLDRGIAYGRTPLVAFYHQVMHAERRAVEWELTAWEWWAIWQESGHWERRGTRHNEYVMCRKGDVGPYAVGNVFIATCADNCSNKKTKTSGLPRGVKKVAKGRMPYAAQRYIDGEQRYLGVFPTSELAHAAYLEAAP